MQQDPRDLNDLASSPEHADILERLVGSLNDELYGDDLAWLDGDRPVGVPDEQGVRAADRGPFKQRGLH